MPGIHTYEIEEQMLEKTFKYLLSIGYAFTEADYKFMCNNEQYYQANTGRMNNPSSTSRLQDTEAR